MAIFPETKPELLDPDPGLQQAFDAAMSSFGGGLDSTPIIIAALNQTEPHDFAGQLGEQVHYSASLLKTAAMWVAFELRRAVNDFVATFGPPRDQTLAIVGSTFDTLIKEDRVAQLAGVSLDGFLLPRWSEVFQLQPDGTVNFTQHFAEQLFDAIVAGKNSAAGSVVHGLGFGYLTRATASAGFFDEDAAAEPQTADGMWLCGDFGHGFPPQRVPCVNDTPVAQATSALQMARLFAFLASSPGAGGAPGVGTGADEAPDTDNTPLVDPASDLAMLVYLFRAAERRHVFLSHDPDVQFITFQSKNGLGPVNNGTTVASEAAIIKEPTSGRRFVAVFQNRVFPDDAATLPISQVVDTTIANFLFPN